MTRPGMLAAAVGYADRGWPVFVLGRSKRPVANCDACRQAATGHDPDACTCLTCHSFYAATEDRNRIVAMLAAVPDGLLAIRTGAAAGLVIVDIDPRNGGTLDQALMPPTAAVSTGGRGWHLYYQHPGETVLSRPLTGVPGVDIKADGGLVVAPPSPHPVTGRPYEWVSSRPVAEMPPALLTAIRTDPPVTKPDPPRSCTPTRVSSHAGERGGGISNPDALLAAHLAAVARAPEGRRRTTLYGAARGIARMVAAGALTTDQAHAALVDAGRAADQTDRDINAAITGGFTAEGIPT
ncbi:bifunctional DNA primase/polymerase [Parafrankia sp. FMc6]|uniref:bifunctional DNA primase/polymerase n=1 Tax=Parafrankia soli TaxID=2599596 RepID=UPI0034D434D7